MGEFQCSSSWGYPEVQSLRYKAYRNYSGLSFSFDRPTGTIVAESTMIRDPRIRCFSWEFKTDDSTNSELDKLVAVGRLAELSCEKSRCVMPAFWSSEVEFSGKNNSCSSSSEYPFSVLYFEEGLMALMNRLSGRIDADVSDSDLVAVEFKIGGRHLELRISGWKEISVSGKSSTGVIWKSSELSQLQSSRILDIMKAYPLGRPMNYYGDHGDDSGSIIFHYSLGSYRIDVDGEGPDWWMKLCERLSNAVDELIKTKDV